MLDGRNPLRPPPGSECADDDEETDEDADGPVAPLGTEGVAQGWGQPARDEDRQREDRDPPRHQAGAFAVVTGQLGRHGDVGDLEEGVGTGAREEEHGDPRGSQGRRGGRPGEEQREEDGERQAGPDEEGAAPTIGVRAAVGDPAGDRVEQDIPGLGQQDDESGEAGGHAEPVGEVGQQEQAGDRAEGARRHRPEAVAAPHASRQHRRVLRHVGRLLTGHRAGRCTRPGPGLKDCASCARSARAAS